MYLMDRISKNVASKMAEELKLDADRQEVIAYGAYGILQTAWSVFLIAVFGFLFGVLWQAVLISFSASYLRKYSGGAHAGSPNRCAVIGVIIFVPLAFVVNWVAGLNTIIVYSIILLEYLCTYFLAYRYCPVDSPAKPIKKQETIKRLRKGSFLLITVAAVASLILAAMYVNKPLVLKIILCVSFGLAWQSITLTSAGHLITNKLDCFLERISKMLTGGEKE